MEIIKGGVTAPKGFSAYGDHIGIKKAKKDLAVIYSEKAATFVGTFTTNVVKAACVQWNMQRYALGDLISAVVINSGNANACTGIIGDEHNALMAQTTAECFGLAKENVVTASTGVIGKLLPIETIVEGIKNVSKQVIPTTAGGHEAATAIMTTDTYVKEIAVEFSVGDKKAVIGGMAKGSGMIHPNMATMLAFITTDLAITKELLIKAVQEDIGNTYNMISVDGDTSTNDMFALLANGMCGNEIIDSEGEAYEAFKAALNLVNVFLSKQIIHDGEGVTKVIEVQVMGAKSTDDAKLLAKSVITSNLVKTAFFGEDANWGRVLCAMGYSGAKFEPTQVALYYESKAGKIKLLENGLPEKFDEAKALEILKEKEITVLIHLKEGAASATAWGCDLSYEYVRINGEYRT
ncbi:MAG: bifunctional glutamate N-acetyltransferase/amino-acid acetyltransferase ArgJ [Vallitaleaceae bacterium]|nr:bifunctional glutamate N-acetyltransferase/amino-acid acetyltransferase ArgJ [Vallitaleaceae bacterium]